MGSYVVSVSAGVGCYRHIQISKSATLYRLHKAIISAFDFEDDHGHAFFMDNKYWSSGAAYFSSEMRNSNGTTKKAKLEKLRLSKGTQFKYIFDFGDEWRFQCKVLREVDEPADIPRVIRRVGDSPEQYPVSDPWDEDVGSEDEEWEDEEWDDEDEPLSREQLEQLYAQIPLQKWEIDRVHKYMDAAANLYGLISLDMLLEIYNSQNRPIEEAAFFMAVMVINLEENPHVIIGPPDLEQRPPAEALAVGALAIDYLFVDHPSDGIRALRRGQEDKPYKILPKEEFLKYADFDYFPNTPQKKAMMDYLCLRESNLSLSPEVFCCGIQNLSVMDAPLREVLDITASEGLTFDKHWDIGEFVQLYQNLNNHTHKHVNRGHTPVELTEALDGLRQKGKKEAEGQISLFDEGNLPPEERQKEEPSRNRRCPCGSGKKYKNCCGKNKQRK